MSVVVTNTPVMEKPEQKKPEPGTAFQVKAEELGKQALAVKAINSVEEFKDANRLFLAQTALIKEVEAFFAGLKGPAHQAWRALCDREKAITGTAEQGKRHLSRLITGYQEEQERLRLEEEARQRQKAAEQAQEQTVEEAIALEAEGDIEGALARLDEGPGFVPAPSVAKTVPKVKGVVSRETYKARLKGSSRNEPVETVDMTRDEQAQFLELIRAVAAGKVPILALSPNWQFLNQQSRSMKKMLAYPGIESYPDKTLSGRT